MEINYVKCELCNRKFKNFIPGAHFAKKHNINKKQYIEQFPNADTGKYVCSNFTCNICNETTKGTSETIRHHLRKHGLSRYEYNIQHDVKYCLCGCGGIAPYSHSSNKFLDYIEGHYHGWNLGLTKHTDERIAKIWSKKFLWNQIDTPETKIIRERMGVTMRNLYASGTIDISKRTEAYKKTMIENYGVENYFATDEFKVRNKERNMELYGVENQMQRPEIFSKNKTSRHKFYDYKCPSGEIRRLQGYEDMALDILFKKYDESDIITKKTEMPKFSFFYEGKFKVHFPDIFIKSENKIIEIKSWWTYNKELFLEEKRQSVIDLGLDYEIWIFNNRKEKELTIL